MKSSERRSSAPPRIAVPILVAKAANYGKAPRRLIRTLELDSRRPDLNDKKRKGVPVDDLHLTVEGHRVLARRMLLQAAALIRGEEPAMNGRPE